MLQSFDKELEVASLAVQAAARLAKQLQASISQVESVEKRDHSPVTIGDFAIQALLTSALSLAFPKDNFIAEESADELRSNASLRKSVWELASSANTRSFFGDLIESSSEQGSVWPRDEDHMLQLIDKGGKQQISNSGRVWVMDPIDGTMTFMEGRQFVINCALLEDGVEKLGIIGCPNIPLNASIFSEDSVDKSDPGSIIYAIRGKGSHVRPIATDGSLAPAKQIPRHGVNAAQADLKWTDAVSATSTIQSCHQQVAAQLRIAWPGTDLYSSVGKYVALARGQAHVCLRVFKHRHYHSNVWDHAGCILIYSEVGGRVTDLSGVEIDFSRGRKMVDNFGLVCAPSSVHAVVLRAVQQAVEDIGGVR